MVADCTAARVAAVTSSAICRRPLTLSMQRLPRSGFSHRRRHDKELERCSPPAAGTLSATRVDASGSQVDSPGLSAR